LVVALALAEKGVFKVLLIGLLAVVFVLLVKEEVTEDP
jgi:hypothetical protein